MRRITPILNRLYLGTHYFANQLDSNNKEGILAVLNCTNDALELSDIIQIAQINLADGEEVPSARIEFALDWIHEQIQKTPVLICCHACASRSPGILVAYLCRCGWDWYQAEDYVKERHGYVMIHPAISYSLRKYLGQIFVPFGQKESTATNEE